VLDTVQRDDVLSGEETKIDGNDAYVATIDTKGTTLERSLLAVIYKDNNIYLFKGEVGKSGDPAKFEADFRATLAALRSMVPADLKVANGQRIKVIEAKPGDTFEKLAKRSSIKRHPVETLRLLNGDAPLGEPTPGDYIKIVQ
jgi:predicted Zn-dependent protease